jgi:hypothetical protein
MEHICHLNLVLKEDVSQEVEMAECTVEDFLIFKPKSLVSLRKYKLGSRMIRFSFYFLRLLLFFLVALEFNSGLNAC